MQEQKQSFIIIIISIWLLTWLFDAVAGEEQEFEIVNLELIKDRELQDFIVSYYEFENQYNWLETYNSRNEMYKKFTDFNVHKNNMSKYTGEWEISKIEILDVKHDDNVINIKIKFMENLSGELANKRQSPLYDESGLFEIVENTKWIKENGKWVVIYPGTRSHLISPEIY